MDVREFRKIILIGYAFDAPDGSPLLSVEGLPLKPLQCPVRMRVAFWVPQRDPFQRRDVGTRADFLASLVKESIAERRAMNPTVISLEERTPNLKAYVRKHRLHERLMTAGEHASGYTFVADASPLELQALRDGALVEQIQDFTFPRQPTRDELFKATYEHWELRALDALGYVPNRPPVERNLRPVLRFDGVAIKA